MKKISVLLTAALCMCGFVSSTFATKYQVDKGTKLRVDVYHPAKHVIAKTKRVKGFVTVKSSANGTYQLDGAFTVKIRKLKSGNRSRDRVMWRALGKRAQKYIYFYPKTLKLSGTTGTVTGEFMIKKNKKLVTLKVTNFSGKVDGKGAISLTLKGKLKCSEFKIKRPGLLFVKIKDKVDVTLVLKLKPGT